MCVKFQLKSFQKKFPSKEARSSLFTDIGKYLLYVEFEKKKKKTLNSNLQLHPIEKERGFLYTSTNTHTQSHTHTTKNVWKDKSQNINDKL